MRVLIGVDDSPHSDTALEFVRRMEWPAGTRMIIASAMRLVEPVYSEAALAVGGYDKRVLEEGKKHHEEIVARAEQKLKQDGFRTEGRILQGDPRESLLEAAREERVDLIVVGSHGRTGLAKMLMGSVASHIVAHAACSVLVVKRDSKAA
jgi:nucleotide-binding universal stress UspA family protein